MRTKAERDVYLFAALSYIEKATEQLNNAKRCGIPASGRVTSILENARELQKDIRAARDSGQEARDE